MLNALTHAGVEVEDRLFVTLDPRTRQRQLARRRDGALHRHRRLHLEPAPRAGRGVHEHAQVGAVGRPLGPRRRRRERPRRRADRRRARRARSRSTRTHVPELLVFNKADAAGLAREGPREALRGERVGLGHDRREPGRADRRDRRAASLSRPRGHLAAPARSRRPARAQRIAKATCSTRRSATTAC